MSPVLEVRNLTKHFTTGSVLKSQRILALNGVSFTIGRGEVLALVGESGSGKSTTARLIARLMPPTSGEILLRGQDVLKTEPRKASRSYRREVQMIFQDPFGSLSPNHTIGYHLERPLLIHKRAIGRDVQQKVETLLATVGLNPPAEMTHKFPFQLSGGQRQRVAIARALAVEPEIILADEPISMLDVSIRMGVLNLMEQLKEERGIGFLYITHDLASARYIADRTIVMYGGYTVESAESHELMAQPAHPYTQTLLAAVPNPQAGLETPATGAPSAPKSASASASAGVQFSPRGCPFAGRCPQVKAICHEVMPGLTTIAPDHWVRCHLFGP